jgi:hypothetical protein
MEEINKMREMKKIIAKREINNSSMIQHKKEDLKFEC